MEEDPEDLSSLHFQIMFPPPSPIHRQREYELEQHLALMDEPATPDLDMEDLGNLTIEHLSSYDDRNNSHEGFLLVEEERYLKADMFDIGIEASDLGSLLQQFEQTEAALTMTEPTVGSEAEIKVSAPSIPPGPKNLFKKINPVKRKSTILMEPLAMPSKHLRDKDSSLVISERISVSLPGSRTTSPLTVEPQGLSIICSADQGFDYLVMDHDYCSVNAEEEKLSNQTKSGPSSPASIAAEQRKAVYRQKYKIRKKEKTKGRVTGGRCSEKTPNAGMISEANNLNFINKLPDYIHPMPEVSAAKSSKLTPIKSKNLSPTCQPPVDTKHKTEGEKPQFFDKIPDYFIGKHMYQEISKVEAEEEMTKLKEKAKETESHKKESEMEKSKVSEGGTNVATHHRSRSRSRSHIRKVKTRVRVKDAELNTGDAPVNREDVQVVESGKINSVKPRSHLQSKDKQCKEETPSIAEENGIMKSHSRHKKRKDSNSKRFSRSRSASSHSSSQSTIRSRSYSSSDSSCSRSRCRGRSYISRSRSRSRSYSRSRSRSRSHSYRCRRRRYSTYSSASHSSSSISRSRSRSHSRSRHWRPRSSSKSYTKSRRRSRSRSRSKSLRSHSCDSDRSWRRSSRRESYRRTHSRSGRRGRRSISIERMDERRERQLEERREKQLEEQIEQWKDRRVVYIGRIPCGTTRSIIRKRFETFGEIERITLHFRDIGDNYAFVTYTYKCDAYAAIEGANKDPNEPVYDICFGGRRQFCKSSYEDLDSMAQEEEAFEYGYNQAAVPNPSRSTGETDFDRLLQEAMKKVKR